MYIHVEENASEIPKVRRQLLSFCCRFVSLWFDGCRSAAQSSNVALIVCLVHGLSMLFSLVAANNVTSDGSALIRRLNFTRFDNDC